MRYNLVNGAKRGEMVYQSNGSAALRGSRLGNRVQRYRGLQLAAGAGSNRVLFSAAGGDIARTAEGFAKQGLNPAWFWAYYIGCLELFGGVCLILGLLTRPVAALFAGFMFVAAFHVHMQIGWFWSNRGMEVPFYLLLICLAILIRGGGPLSLDRRLGREI
jgi:putative oxidoreductase